MATIELAAQMMEPDDYDYGDYDDDYYDYYDYDEPPHNSNLIADYAALSTAQMESMTLSCSHQSISVKDDYEIVALCWH